MVMSADGIRRSVSTTCHPTTTTIILDPAQQPVQLGTGYDNKTLSVPSAELSSKADSSNGAAALPSRLHHQPALPRNLAAAGTVFAARLAAARSLMQRFQRNRWNARRSTSSRSGSLILLWSVSARQLTGTIRRGSGD